MDRDRPIEWPKREYDDLIISVTELACREPGCPDGETIVAAMRAGEGFAPPSSVSRCLSTADNLAAEFARLG
jgi:hypothetical protein